MAPFDERDDMDSYIFRFERYAELQNWNPNDWAVYLAALLRGKALEVYARLTEEGSKDYKTLKEALLRRYQLTEDGYKRRFHSAKSDQGESPPQFIARLKKYLLRWIELAGINQTYEAVCDLVVREQYFSSCGKEQELFLRERALTDLTELGKLAEQYEDAHKSGIKKGFKPTETKSPETHTQRSSINSNTTQGQHQGQPQGQGQGRECFVCGK